MTPHIHIEDARAAIDAINNELTTWINRTRDAEHEAYLLEDRLHTLGYEHRQLEQEFVDLSANAQWLADIIRSHLPHLPEAREALDASPGVSAARMKAQWQVEALEELAAEQEATNAKYPRHAAAYQLWRDIPIKLREYADRYRHQAEGGE